MPVPLAFIKRCDCGDCDFCGKGRGARSRVQVVEIWQKAYDGANNNTDLHICRACATTLLSCFDSDTAQMIRGKR